MAWRTQKEIIRDRDQDRRDRERRDARDASAYWDGGVVKARTPTTTSERHDILGADENSGLPRA